MKLRSSFVVALLAFSLTTLCAQADEAQPPNYMLFAVKTDLQRELLNTTRADAYLQFDVEECLHHGKFELKRFDQEGFQKTLAALARQIGKPEPRLVVGYRYSSGFPNPDETEAMQQAVKTTCRQAGFVNGGTITLGEGGSWQEKVAKFSRVADEADAAESPLDDDLARLYPVRTQFSRFLLGDPHDDCYIEVRQAIDGRFKQFSAETTQALGQRLAQLHLPHRRHLILHFLATTAGQNSVERFLDQAGKPSRADGFAEELGFQSAGYSLTPMSVRPEELLGKPAPDFTLESLAGGPLHLREMIRGKVAVIAFWGVACGACCEEAPHLTALYNQYKDKGLAVVGVNGYNESKPKVDRFVRAKHLTHAIALMGGKVAQEYTVASYPVTWLVDHKGTIVDYHLGFDAGDEKRLAKTITRLLAERARAIDHP
ncbi:MAG TPA: TlpA disulfide reductase family protein [Planctomycetaceae bacterium]|jgi:peroxiredoxin|nr:TlpA disulfide reductase family protein [Planctomycetaceae bacterium]